MHQAKWMKAMIYRWVADNERPAATIDELSARQARQFGGARVPSLNVQKCDLCGRDYAHPSMLLMAFSDDGEIMKRSYLKSMTESELLEMIKNTPKEGGLPFLNTAWQNRNRDAYQYCMLCYGKHFKGCEAHYLQYGYKEKSGKREWAVTKEWQKLREQCLGFSDNRKVKKVRDKMLRLWRQNRQHSNEFISLIEVHEKLTNSFMLCKAVDFIAFFGVSGLAYCCPRCLELPTNPKYWLRCLKVNWKLDGEVERLLELERKQIPQESPLIGPIGIVQGNIV